MSAKARQRPSLEWADSIWYYKAGFAAWFFLQAGAAIFLSLFKFGDDGEGEGEGDCTWLSTTLNVTSDYRTDGSIKDPASAGALYYGWPVIGQVGPVNLGLVIGLASASELLWLLVQLFFHEREIAMISNDHNPYRWWRFGWSHGLLFLAIALEAGVPNVWLLVFTVMAVLTWLVDFNNTERYNSVAVNQSRFQRVAADERTNWYVYDDFLFALGNFVVVAVMLFVYLGNAASPDEFDVEGVGLPAIAWVGPIAGVAIYLGLPIILALHHSETAIVSVYDKERALFWWQFVFITAITWLSLGFFTQIDC